MFFNKIPNIEYDQKPLSFPISDSQYVLAKNFFKSFKVSDTAFSSTIYFNKYTILDGERPDLLAEKFYGNPGYDWVILVTNNIINPLFDYPLENIRLYDFVSKIYDDPDAVHHYETLQVTNFLGEEVLKAGLIVDETYATTAHTFPNRNNNSTGATGYFTKEGSEITTSVTNYEYEKNLNDQKREIYILRREFLSRFVSKSESLLEYSPSSSYIDRMTKKSGS